MAVAPVKTATNVGYGPSLSTARAPLSVRAGASSQAYQIDGLQGSQLAGSRADASTPDGYEGFGPQAPRPAASVTPTQVPSFGHIGLAPMAYFAQEKSETQGSTGNLSRGLGPQASNKGAGIYESAKRTIEGAAQENYRFS